jgi:hypothetical protein
LARDSEPAHLASLTEQILERFTDSLLESSLFDAAQIRRLRALATGSVAPKAAELEKLFEQEEPLE